MKKVHEATIYIVHDSKRNLQTLFYREDEATEYMKAMNKEAGSQTHTMQEHIIHMQDLIQEAEKKSTQKKEKEKEVKKDSNSKKKQKRSNIDAWMDFYIKRQEARGTEA